MTDGALTIGSLAAQVKVNRETIRFYQRTGLLNDAHRSKAGYRQFTTDDLKRVLFIRRAKDSGFTLAEIRALLAVADGEVVRCSEVRAIAERALGAIEARLDRLGHFRKILKDLVRQCRTSSRIDGCPIIDQLSKGE